MENQIALSEIQQFGQKVMGILTTKAHPVGVRFGFDGEIPSNAKRLYRHRYCQAVMQARTGQHVVLEGAGLSCPAAASAFGFRPLPENLKNGKGLVGFGIVASKFVGKKMFEDMKRFSAHKLRFLHLFPLDEAVYPPDVVLIEDEIEKLMWIALAALNANGGERLNSSTAVLQAICVDCTIIPFLEQKINLTYGCYGCREATNLSPHEAAIGFSLKLLPGIIEHLEFLAQKAMLRSREKKPYRVLQNELMSMESHNN